MFTVVLERSGVMHKIRRSLLGLDHRFETMTQVTSIDFTWICRWLLFVGCLTSQQHASVSQGRICSDNFTCCHSEIEVADQTFYLTQLQYTDTGPTSPSANPITPGAWQGSHWSANFFSHWYDSTPAQAGFEPGIFRSGGGRLNH